MKVGGNGNNQTVKLENQTQLKTGLIAEAKSANQPERRIEETDAVLPRVWLAGPWINTLPRSVNWRYHRYHISTATTSMGWRMPAVPSGIYAPDHRFYPMSEGTKIHHVSNCSGQEHSRGNILDAQHIGAKYYRR